MNRKLVVLVAALLTLAGCGRNQLPPGADLPPGASEVPAARTGPVSMNKADYPVFPNADAGADPAVPAAQGGKGFDGKGWETNTDFDLLGDPHAVKGGVFRDFIQDFPGTLRLVGPDANTYFNGEVVWSMVYETLLGLDSHMEYMPLLATHWQISPDHMTYRFRLNPNARFSDGTPVTSEDVVASWDFYTDKTLQDPAYFQMFTKLDRPVAESKYIVRVHSKMPIWKNFLVFSNSMPIFPARVLKTINGDKFLKKYNFKLLPSSGPYMIREEDVVKGRSVSLRRRNDYWNATGRAAVGLNNFDEVRLVVVRDDNLVFEMFKKGDLDRYVVVRSPRQWAQEMDFDAVQRGLVQRKKVFNLAPQVRREFAFNMRQPPFNDIRVRKAFTLLLDRKLIIDKVMFGEYVPTNSFYAGEPYENPDNPKNEYNPQEALKLLAEAGWNAHDSQGRLTKNGVPLQIEFLYRNQIDEPQLTIYQEALRKVGIQLNLRLLTWETQIQLVVDQRKFQMAQLAWGGVPFPDPEVEWHSSLADLNSNNNLTGVKDARLDQLCEEYNKAFEMKDRVRILRQVDSLMANLHDRVLLWSAPSVSIAYWNRFGMPQGVLPRGFDEYYAYPYWWIDADKSAKLQQAQRDSSIKLPIGPMENKYWLEYAKTDKQ